MPDRPPKGKPQTRRFGLFIHLVAPMLFAASVAWPWAAIAAAETASCNLPEEIKGNVVLNRGCRYHGSLRIQASNTHLNCNGAVIDGDFATQDGIIVGADVRITNISVKNCTVTKFKRFGFYIASSLSYRNFTENPGNRHEFTLSNVLIENNNVIRNSGNAIFIGDNVDHVKVIKNKITKNQGVGIYFEFSSHHNLVTENDILENGRPFNLDSKQKVIWPRLREGISVDSSFENTITKNNIKNNGAGGIFLYRNCTEGGLNDRRAPWREHGANRNKITDNMISGEGVGVWIAQRQSKDLAFMRCGREYYADGSIVLDAASENYVANNNINTTESGIIVEDDNNKLYGNKIHEPSKSCIVVDAHFRKSFLNRPVVGTDVKNNVCLNTNKH